MLICLKCIRYIELYRYEINYSINECQLNNKSHDFHLHKLSILREYRTQSLNVGCFDISRVRSNLTFKTSICWATTFSAEGTHILKMEFIVSL